MKFQLWLQQLGYFIEGSGNEITTKWNDMIMTLQCCGVNHNNETYTTNGIKFCCKNAHPRILDSAGYNTNFYSSFDYLGGCGGYKTETCADVILFKTKMFVGWFLAIVLLQIVLEIIGFVFVSKEYLVIMLTKSAGNPTGATLNAKSVIFRKMVKEIKSFCVSNWKRSKISLVHFISLGCLFIFNIVVLCLAINIRFDKVFGNSDVQELFSRINVTDQIFTRSINIFSIVTVTFSSVSIAVAILSIFVMVLPKWKSVLSFVSAGVLCIVAVANLLQEGLWVIFFNNVSSELEDELMKQFNSTNGGYDYSDKSATRDWSLSLSWNTLFVQAECCGVGPMIESSFKSTYWYLYDRSAGQRIPVQCCISQTNVFPYSTRTDSNCSTSMLDGYYRSQSCDVAVKERLEIYSTIFIVFMAMIIFVEICCVVTTLLNAIRFKKDTKMMQVSVKAGGKGVGIRKDNATQKVGDNAKKKRNQRNKEDNRANRSSKNELRLSVRTVDLHKKANTIVQENIEDIIELQSIKSMEFEDKVNDKPDKPTDNIRQEVDELARNDITMPDN
ncbi:uncharacterized protein LOC127706057 [Mytilus californianus]|uniref:uncharacterized protein LOC127706057 n=1 Tax=Mytilus californianus TaxID=6549 RepID=UPI0022461BAB|nr:uncharacterized protein LOC127706057 [Mytilus californianus]